MVGSKDSETRYKLCRDMPMEKGPIFEEWLKEFLDAAGGEGDDDASWAQTLEGTDRRAGLSDRTRTHLAQQAAGALTASANQLNSNCRVLALCP